MSEKFKILPHTADFRIKVFGKDLRKLFKNSFVALGEIMKPRRAGKEIARAHLAVRSLEKNTLLVDFLNEVLREMQTKKAVFDAIEILKFSDDFLEADIMGKKIDEFREDIKAVTYHEVEIKKSPEGELETNLIFDI